MQNNNKISVIIPTYNSVNKIEKTLKSLKSQTTLPDELIFSDDGSTDGTVKLLKEWIKKNQILNSKIIENEHFGPGNSRNMGIFHATSAWISFLDSDDTWENEKINEVKKIIDKERDINFITHYEFHVGSDNVKKEISTKLKIFLQQQTDLKKFLYISNIFSTSAVTCKKEILFKNKMFDIGLPNAQDYDLWLKLSPQINLYVIQKNLGTYYDTVNNITSRPYFKKVKSELIICLRYRKLVNFSLFLKKLAKILINKSWFKF
jgi:glycosyltransferase involved in cell wall biosynthesis